MSSTLTTQQLPFKCLQLTEHAAVRARLEGGRVCRQLEAQGLSLIHI